MSNGNEHVGVCVELCQCINRVLGNRRVLIECPGVAGDLEEWILGIIVSECFTSVGSSHIPFDHRLRLWDDTTRKPSKDMAEQSVCPEGSLAAPHLAMECIDSVG
jgi:hypothetical protein